MRLDHEKGNDKEKTLQVERQGVDEQEFVELFRRYYPLVRKLWQQFFVPELELADWEQESRMVMIKVMRSYRGTTTGQFSGFLKQSLINRILDLYRARQANKRIPAGLVAPMTDDYNETLCDYRSCRPEEVTFCQYSVQELLEECSSFVREVLICVHQGYSTTEAASQLGCSKRKVQSALSRARTKLLHILAQ